MQNRTQLVATLSELQPEKMNFIQGSCEVESSPRQSLKKWWQIEISKRETFTFWSSCAPNPVSPLIPCFINSTSFDWNCVMGAEITKSRPVPALRSPSQMHT